VRSGAEGAHRERDKVVVDAAVDEGAPTWVLAFRVPVDAAGVDIYRAELRLEVFRDCSRVKKAHRAGA
jgi:hypothetical protein